MSFPLWEVLNNLLELRFLLHYIAIFWLIFTSHSIGADASFNYFLSDLVTTSTRIAIFWLIFTSHSIGVDASLNHFFKWFWLLPAYIYVSLLDRRTFYGYYHLMYESLYWLIFFFWKRSFFTYSGSTPLCCVVTVFGWRSLFFECYRSYRTIR